MRHLFSSALCAAMVLAATGASAQWQPGGIGTQGVMSVSDGTGRLIGISGGSVAMVDTAGLAVWTVAMGTTAESTAPDYSGGIIVAWAGSNVLANRVSPAGSALWGAGVTVCGAANIQVYAAVSTDEAGNSYYTWKDRRAGTENQIFAQKLDPAGVPQWLADGVLITNQGVNVNTQPPRIVADESGGCYVFWQDARAGAGIYDIFAQRVDATGAVAWQTNGVGFCDASGTQDYYRAISDGTHGAIVVWQDKRSVVDYDLYMQRINQNGIGLWTPNGIALADTPLQDQAEPVILADGAGGAFIAWHDCKNCGSTGLDIYAQRIDGNGASLWTPGGVLVCDRTGHQTSPGMTLDGTGGIFLGWVDTVDRVQHLTGAGAEIWPHNGLQASLAGTGRPWLLPDGIGGVFVATPSLGRIRPNGEMAWVTNYRTVITAVADVPADEGGWVRVDFNRPPISDALLSVTPQTTGYSLWRKQPGSGAAGAARRIDPRGLLPAEPFATQGYADFPPGTWEAAGYIPALQRPTYSMVAPTHTDFVGTPADEEFMVVAHTSTFGMFIVSAVASGHSIDNLAPGTLQNLIGGLSGEQSVQLSWSPSPAPDLAHYAVYKGTSPSFTPAPENRIGEPTLPTLEDVAYEPGVSHYKVSAIDRHGNESGHALLAPSQIISVPIGTLPTRTYLAGPTPHPSRGAAVLEYGIARGGPVTLRVYDLGGRLVATLVNETQDPGVRRAAWTGRNQSQEPVPAGLYLVRLVADRVVSRKIVRIE